GSAQVSLTNATVEATVEEVEIETATVSGTVAVTGNAVTLQTLNTAGNTTLQVAGSSAVQVNAALNVNAGETLGVTGGGTVAINSSNSGLGSTATVAVSDSTLRLGSVSATGSAQVSLTNATVEATVEEVEIETASVSGNVTFSGNAVVVGTLNTSTGAANLTTSDAGVQVEALSGSNNVTVAGGKITLTGDSTAYTQQLEISSDAEVEVGANAVLGGSVTLAGTGTINGTVEGVVTVNDASAVLGGSGAFEGGLTIASGILEPGQSPGEITVSGGDFVLGAGATLNIEVDEEGNHDSIRVTDDSNANFVTGAKVVAVAIGSAPSGTYDIVTLEGSGSIQVDGDAVGAHTSLAAFIQNTDLATISSLVVDDTGQVVEMNVHFTSNTEYLQDTGSKTVRSVGRMLDSDAFAESATEELLEIVAQAQASDDIAGSYAQMANQLQTSASFAASRVVSAVNTNLGQRMQNARTVARNTLVGSTSGPSLASLSPMSVSDPSCSGWQAFAQGYGSWGDRADDGGVVGYDYDTYGTLVGAEKFVSENVVLGGSIGYGGTSVDSGDDLSSMDIDSLSASLYGTWFNSTSYVGLTLGYGYHWYDSTRRLSFAGLRADGEFDAQTLSIAPEIGRLFRCGSYGIEPYVGLNYTHFAQDGYTEEGAGDADLSVGDDTDDSFSTELGTHLYRTWAMRNGGSLTPELKLAWRHEFADEVVTVARLAGAGTSFKTTGIEVVDDIFSIGVGLNWQIDKSKTFCAQYDADLGSGFDAHTLQTYISIQF
ncbi:MAG TPA: autotransporter domain-containing protein, partial [Sedimentisphaerales bacterium]|nr:autotransporter domain-containing protein [Sedimentisphaerales bacterium]HNU29410.1 autotransporter domain-containing protein [Sedimentisphaerales bacterium]